MFRKSDSSLWGDSFCTWRQESGGDVLFQLLRQRQVNGAGEPGAFRLPGYGIVEKRIEWHGDPFRENCNSYNYKIECMHIRW